MITDHILPPDTQAILLLCGYFGGHGNRDMKPLSLSEYNKLAVQLHKKGLRPSHMVEGDVRKKIDQISFGKIDPERLHFLLGRGVEMGFAVEEWARQGIWVLSRGDESYPRILKARLRETAPPLLYGVGNRFLLRNGGLGMVGSRDAEDTALRFTRGVARRCAAERLSVVSGGAKGVDREAMAEALTAGGFVLGVLPEGIAKIAVSKANRRPIAEGRLTLVSPYHPNARWTSGNAMGRNKHIYAFSDWTLVVSSGLTGGTWNGATESIKKGWGRLLVRASPEAPEGNTKLIGLGGTPLEPDAIKHADSLQELLAGLFQDEYTGNGTYTLFSRMRNSPTSQVEAQSPHRIEPPQEVAQKVPDDGNKPKRTRLLSTGRQTIKPVVGDLLEVVWPSLSLAFVEERTDSELADFATSFNIQIGQLKAWVKQAVEQGYVEKRTHPVRYILKPKVE